MYKITFKIYCIHNTGCYRCEWRAGVLGGGVKLLPHRSTVSGLILSSGYCMYNTSGFCFFVFLLLFVFPKRSPISFKLKNK